MQNETGLRPHSPALPDRHVDCLARLAEAVPVGGCAVAEHGALARVRQRRRELVLASELAGVGDIDPWVRALPTPGPYPMVQLGGSHTESPRLRPCQHPAVVHACTMAAENGASPG